MKKYIFRTCKYLSIQDSLKNSFSSNNYVDVLSHICLIADCLRSQLRFSILRDSLTMSGYKYCIVYFFKKPVGFLYVGG